MTKKRLIAAALGIALAGVVGGAQALTITPTVVDTAYDLDIVWNGNLLTDTFALPTLTNWSVSGFTFAAGPTTVTIDYSPAPGVVIPITFQTKIFATSINASHLTSPHGEASVGTTFSSGLLTGTFGSTSIVSNTVSHVPHWDSYTFSVVSTPSGAGSVIELKGVHPVPEPESYAMLLAGLGVMGAIIRRRSRNRG